MPPFYEYRCRSCKHESTELRCIAMRDAKLSCAQCSKPMRRILSATPGVVKNPAVEKASHKSN